MENKLVAGFLIILAVVAVLTAVFASGIYRLAWDNEMVRTFVRVVPLPAAVVGGKFITINKLNQVAALTGQRQEALASLIEDQIIKDLAKKSEISSSSSLLNRYHQYWLKKSNLATDQKAGDWKNLVVLPELRKMELGITLLKTRAATSPAYQKLKEVEEKLRAGADFSDQAALASEDEASKWIGGDLGFFAQDDLPPAIADVVFDLEIHEISEITPSAEGYHIFRVTARDEQNSPPRLQTRHILVRDNYFEDFFAEAQKNYRVYTFVKF